MLLNYVKLALRLLIRNPFLSLIKVAGLAIGFAVFFILSQHAMNELRSDQFNVGWKNIVRLNFYANQGAFHERMAVVHPAFAQQLSERIPALSDRVRVGFQNEFNKIFTGDHGKEISLTYINDRHQKVAFKEDKVIYADENLFDFFTIPIIEGNHKTILRSPNTIAISETLALKYFGSTNAAGEVLLLNDTLNLMVSGVFKDLPSNSHLQFNAVMPISRIANRIREIRMDSQAYFGCYFRLPQNVDRALVVRQIDTLKTELLTLPFERMDWSVADCKLSLQPLDDVMFERVRGDEFHVKSKLVLHIFEAIAAIVLIMAWINFINLMITSNASRAKELAARLGVGARPVELMTQFIVEAAVVNIMALLFAGTIIQLMKEPVRTLLHFSVPEWNEMSMISIVLILVFVVTGILISGVYPAVVTVRHTPISLFGNVLTRKRRMSVSHLLTIVQFSAASVLIVWAFAVSSQMNFILNKSLGFERDNVVVVDLPYRVTPNLSHELSQFLKQLGSIQGVNDFTTSASVAGDNEAIGTVFRNSDNMVMAATDGGVDERFLNFYGIHILAGRNFKEDQPGNERGVIITRKVLTALHLKTPEQAVGLPITILRPHEEVPAEIIGVVEDYERMPLTSDFQSYWKDDAGICLTYGTHLQPLKRPKKVSIKIGAAVADDALSEIALLYKNSFHGGVFNWSFLDEHVNAHYQNEKIIRNQIIMFTALAIGIACLGLLGTVSYTILEKNKEIGIRKILGARAHNIAGVLLNTTIKQVLVSVIIAMPLAFFLIEGYKANFISTVEVRWWHYVLPLLILVLILLCSILMVVVRAARKNPVETLHYE